MSHAESGLFAFLLLPLLPRAVLCCAEISVHPFIRFPVASKASSWLEWVSASCFFMYLIVHIIIFILLLALLVARLGKIRKTRLCFWCTQLQEKISFVALDHCLEQGERIWTIITYPCPSRHHSQGNGYKMGCTHEGSLAQGKKIFKLTFIYFLILKILFCFKLYTYQSSDTFLFYVYVLRI